MSKFRFQRLFAIVLGLIVLVMSLIISVNKTDTLVACFMVFWGFDEWVRE